MLLGAILDDNGVRSDPPVTAPNEGVLQ
jgi:hypothetical protein